MAEMRHGRRYRRKNFRAHHNFATLAGCYTRVTRNFDSIEPGDDPLLKNLR
jgi:hypothetical protein